MKDELHREMRRLPMEGLSLRQQFLVATMRLYKKVSVRLSVGPGVMLSILALLGLVGATYRHQRLKGTDGAKRDIFN